jgi:hypothetical protein
MQAEFTVRNDTGRTAKLVGYVSQCKLLTAEPIWANYVPGDAWWGMLGGQKQMSMPFESQQSASPSLVSGRKLTVLELVN